VYNPGEFEIEKFYFSYFGLDTSKPYFDSDVCDYTPCAPNVSFGEPFDPDFSIPLDEEIFVFRVLVKYEIKERLPGGGKFFVSSVNVSASSSSQISLCPFSDITFLCVSNEPVVSLGTLSTEHFYDYDIVSITKVG
jgi:hypothetical protein